MEPRMDDATMVETYDILNQWTDSALFTEESPFPELKYTYDPILLSQTFPFETLTPENSPSTDSSPRSSFDYHYSPPTSIRSQTPPLPLENFEPIPIFYDLPQPTPQTAFPTIKRESSPPLSLPSRPSSPPPLKLNTRKSNPKSKVQKQKAPPSPSAIERRRQQNRASQSAFRERTKKLVDDLKKQLEVSEAERLMLRRILEQVVRGQQVRT